MDISLSDCKTPSVKREAWIVGNGTASLASALYLIKRAKMCPSDVHILDEHLSLGHSLHRQGTSKTGYDQFAGCLPVPIGPHLEELLSMVPSAATEGGSLIDDIKMTERRRHSECESKGTCFVVQKKGFFKHLSTKSLNLSFLDRLSLLRLMVQNEKALQHKKITEMVPRGFFDSSFWMIWSSQFGFQPWHSASEFKRSVKQYLSEFSNLNLLSCLDITGQYQFESIYLPIYFHLRGLGVDYQFDSKIKNIEFSSTKSQQKIMKLCVLQHGLEIANSLGPDDIVIAALGSTVSGSAVGTNTVPPAGNFLQSNDHLDENWSLWLNLANRCSGFGDPYTFCTRKSESMIESFTITTDNLSFSDTLKSKLSCSFQGGAMILLNESSWGVKLCIPLQPVFAQQPKNTNVIWGFAHKPGSEGNFVKRKMLHCSGAQILEEILHHLELSDDMISAVLQQSSTIPRAMPRMSSCLMTRALKDRPSIIPHGCHNLGIVGPFVEAPRLSCVDLSYGVDAARIAVSYLTDLPIPYKPSSPTLPRVIGVMRTGKAGNSNQLFPSSPASQIDRLSPNIMRYSTPWHPLHKVPIVNGSYQNPTTGEIEQYNLSHTYVGPPSVHIMWFNIHENSTFRSIGATFASSLDEAFAAISGHVRDNLYSLVSVNATLYAITVVCSTSRADIEIGGAVQDMQRDLNRDVVIPEEEVAAVREWNIVAGDENKVSIEGAEV